ncbi:hypothetical protein CLV63_11286 [Murinocardiopsis flavida]|uniref:Roadblock/LAMTOR2 domain-containing protein n=1 Tax=Murinocardiopsis flavida TaxID=645275 RepID=A0A2P8DG64_9ACTN|nr:roadblock/LC7 domain-containing protein [Murinocardiopsis flavida]PSK96204.1 hypothetical protein CLV63_11286 [Murinocardiopsis flavida]
MTPPTPAELETADDFAWLLRTFAADTAGVEHALLLTSDGMGLAASPDLPGDHADQLAAAVSGLHGLAESAGRMFGSGEPEQLLLRMRRGHLVVMAISDGSRLAVLTRKDADTKVVAYQMSLLVDDAGHALTPAVRDQLLNAETPEKKA